MNQEKITTIIDKKVAYITFFHPAKNSFPSHQLEELTQQLEQISIDKNIHCVVLQSQGNTFCAGASFDELQQITNFESGKKFFSGFANVINAMRKCPQLIIGKVQGKAVGGGVGLIAACDYVFATEQAAIKLSEIAIGIGPFVIEPALSRKIGTIAMANLALNPTNWQTPQWALEKGLYNQLTTPEELDNEVQKYANQLASYNPEALSELKKILWQNTDNWTELLHQRAEISGKLVLSDFTKNALNQFKK